MGTSTREIQLKMQIRIRAGDDKPLEWFMIEMQGDLESRTKERLEGKLIGDLYFNKEGVPIMIIGHHILYGKVQVLDKPLVTLKKKQPEASSMTEKQGGEEELMDLDREMEVKTEYEVKSIIRKKIIFKTRPKPIIANVAKTV